MGNTISTVALESGLLELDVIKLDEGIFQVTAPKQAPIVLEVLAIDFELKTMTIRTNHNKYDLEFKDNLDFVLDKMGIKRAVNTISTDIKAPMPGKVIDILVKEGDTVNAGDGILILEAMKMENVLKAEHDCTIKKVLAITGESVEKNQILFELA
jgi:biotin carboxyl carrier protein